MKNNIKVIFVSPYFKPVTGGLENYVANIEKGLKTLSWDTVVITSNEVGKSYKEEIIDGTKVYRLPTLIKVSNTPVNPFWYFYIKNIIKKEKPDIVNGHAPVPFISDMAALACGKIPFVFTYHAGTMKKKKFLPDTIIWLYENTLLKMTAKKAVKIICPSHFVINTVLHQFKHKATVVTPGVDLDIFKPSESNITEKNTVLFVARYSNMYKMKGLYVLIEAMKLLPNLTLKVVGEPVETDAKNIIFLGTKSVQDTVKEFQKCILFTLPSLAHAESFGMVLIEAMACGKPVVGTRIGGIPEVIIDGVDGLIVASEDVNDLAEAIKKITGDEKFAHNLSQNGFKKITTKYNWPIKVKETNEVFSKILK